MLFICLNSNAQQKDVRLESAPQAYSTMEMELVLWFMGTKKCKTSAGFDDSATSHRKEIIQSGMTPNRILTRTFMNKALNYESTLV